MYIFLGNNVQIQTTYTKKIKKKTEKIVYSTIHVSVMIRVKQKQFFILLFPMVFDYL